MINRRFILRTVAEAVSLVRVACPVRPGLRILMYHSVGHRALGDTQGIFSISQQRFRGHVRLLAEMEYCQAISLQPLDFSKGGLQVAVTFDDGYRDNLRVAAPILVEHGIPFTVFVSSDFIKNHTAGFLTSEELIELAGLPRVTIGAHGKSHRPLTTCNKMELESELSGSKHYLEDLLGRSVTALAYPYGLVNVRVRDEAERLGYDLGVCTRFDINMPERDPLLLCRCNIECNDASRVFQQKIYGNWDWYRWRNEDPVSQQSRCIR